MREGTLCRTAAPVGATQTTVRHATTSEKNKTAHAKARSALECGSEAAALECDRKAVAGATALQGAFGTRIFRAVRDSPPPAALLEVTSFPRKRESIVLNVGPRFRGDDNAIFHSLGWAVGPP
jgi:hypothetical protein